MNFFKELGEFQMYTEKITDSTDVFYELRGKYTGIIYETSHGSIKECNDLLELYIYYEDVAEDFDDDDDCYPTEEDLLEYGDISYFENQH